ncbi:unnamed protein product, partial [Iphiclides podalirius]
MEFTCTQTGHRAPSPYLSHVHRIATSLKKLLPVNGYRILKPAVRRLRIVQPIREATSRTRPKSRSRRLEFLRKRSAVISEKRSEVNLSATFFALRRKAAPARYGPRARDLPPCTR